MITKQIGIKAANEELSEKQYGAIIIDLRDIKEDGSDEPTVINAKLQSIFQVVSLRRNTIILQDSDGKNVAPAFVAALMTWGMILEWDDAVEFITKKNPTTELNKDLALRLKTIVQAVV